MKSNFLVSGAFTLSIVVTQSIFLGSVNCKGLLTGIANSPSDSGKGTGFLLLQAVTANKAKTAEKILCLIGGQFSRLNIKILF